ncbi:MAG: hypothetical protein JXA30_14290 [Deltaproteobacteria bacterium]|nr:hypothetical protein [Deltaproteobacteria bacterium]
MGQVDQTEAIEDLSARDPRSLEIRVRCRALPFTPPQSSQPIKRARGMHQRPKPLCHRSHRRAFGLGHQLGKTKTAIVVVALLLLTATPKTTAQVSPIEMWAQWAVGQGRWKGPTVPYPQRVSRPDDQGWMLQSERYPLCVHAPPAVSEKRVHETLAALEQAYTLLIETGWPEPVADGGYGGTASFDLYLISQSALSTRAFVDAPVAWSLLDSASTYAVVDASVSSDRLQACVVSALVQAVLLGQDPAEAEAWRRATGAYVAWLISGRYGCDDDVEMKQENPWQGWITDSLEYGEGGALFLAALSERADGGSGTFLRELWQFARQKSEDKRWLRGSPDLWEALDKALKNAGDSLVEIVEDIAVARYFAGSEPRRRRAPFCAFKTLREDGRVPVLGPISIAQLPKHLPVSDPPLETYGSGYTMVDTAQALFPLQLKIWLRGEHGGRWSLIAIRLSKEGQELGRMAVPARRDPNSYLALELTRETDRVLIVVTNLSDEVPDADLDTRNGRVYRLILDKSESAIDVVPVTMQAE